MKLVQFKLRMYGDYKCSCGCGKPLGFPEIDKRNESLCYCVGDEKDEEGYEYRCFTKECWDKLNLNSKKLDEIYSKYEIPEKY